MSKLQGMKKYLLLILVGLIFSSVSLAQSNPYSDTTGISISNPYPNPANENVTFKYTLSSSSNQAYMVIYDLLGNKAAEKQIFDKGGVVTLNTSDLLSGIYFYALKVDDKAYFTRKMFVKH